MGRKEPYIDFYTGDWMKDQAVSRCTPATRGVWIDLLCAMHDDGRSGKLCGTRDQLARLARCSTAELDHALADLQTTGAADVTERNGFVTVINRRMFRNSQERAKTRLRVAEHRASKPVCNGDVTPKKRGPPIDSDSDSEISSSGKKELPELPAILDCHEFRSQFEEWLAYKAERREPYKPTGLRKVVSRASAIATQYGVAAVVDAMAKAIANGHQGWDFGRYEAAKPAKQPEPARRPQKPVPERVEPVNWLQPGG